MPAYSKMIAGTETNSLPILNDGKIVILLAPRGSLPSPVPGAPGLPRQSPNRVHVLVNLQANEGSPLIGI